MAKHYAVLLCIVAMALSAPAAEAAEDSRLFDAPKLDGITIDGSPDDWGDRGLVVGVMTTPEGTMRSPEDFDAAFRLGWDNRGLLLLVTVRDNVPVESEDIGQLWMRDSIEAFVAPEVGGPDYYQVAITPGRAESQAELRHRFYDFRRTEPKRELSVDAGRSLTDTGYVLEVLLPWTNLPDIPKAGDEIGFQLFVTDADSAADRFQVQFYPLSTAHSSYRMHRIRLATVAGPSMLAKATAEYLATDRIRLEVAAVGQLVGAKLSAKAGSKTLAEGVLAAEAGRARADIFLAEIPEGRTYDTVTLHARGEQIGSLLLPDIDKVRARTFMGAQINFKPYVFTGAAFPECDFEHPHAAQGLLGNYAIETTFYDRDYNQVKSAETPGRYGAVIEIVPERGRCMRRFRTLVRLPDSAEELPWWGFQGDVSMSLPQQYRIDPMVLAEHKGEVSGYIWEQFHEGFDRSRASATLMAGLYEATPTGSAVRANNGVQARDRQWWVGLKRKLYGTDTLWPKPFTCPRSTGGQPATAIRTGTAAQAGMKPDAAETIDGLLHEWAANSDEAFAVCIARNGVVFLHEAYGERDGKPMTVTTKSWMASITKLLSGTLMMMCVDQGLVDLDDPVDAYLPPFGKTEPRTALTIRHLYTHTNGLWGHWGDDMHDFEEVIVEYSPFLSVGTEHLYNGAGYAIGGKIIEAVTGEAIPGFYVNHLLGPLGCENTDVLDTSGGARSVPMDIAKIGQMLLNRGSYGNLRFFSEETFEKMMPRKLTKLLGPLGDGIEWGIGVVWMNAKGLSRKTFGHGAASAATLLIDPDNKLVIVMTRDNAGKNFTEYHQRFIATIVDNLAEHLKEESMLSLDANTGRLYSPKMETSFADRPYQYALSGSVGGEGFSDVGLIEKTCTQKDDETIVTGRFANSNIALVQAFNETEGRLEETITLRNTGTEPVTISDIEIGFVTEISERPDWRLCAIPFRVQLNGSVHDYSTEALINGQFSNAVYSDETRPEPPLTEEGRLRSEAWAWWNGERGLAIIKYNNEAIELSVACPRKQGDEWELRFGGAGFCLYGEPSTARHLAPGEQVTFGTTLYVPFEGGLSEAFSCYRDFLDSKGHTFPPDYNPPVNWNELYDIGWYHSNKKYLKEHYTRRALLREAEKAKACGCELLYLDPGWEVVEGTTLWDESRLGTVPELVKTLKEEYGLYLGYRTILRCYREHWPNEYLVKHREKEQGPVHWPGQKLWEPCLCYPKFQQEKLNRILDISQHGIRFMMFDEMDWRGPCHDASHGHPVPTTPLDHIRAVYDLCNEVRKRCPGLIVEAHDPVWPWHTAIYAPTYFQQGFGDDGSYDENWGFEYMWNCIDDLRSGKALALYYYNLGCNIPLYLHITMAADNDNCLFFWWAASTIRHLGIGGKESHKSVEPRGGLPPYDQEKRFAAYQIQMKIYQQLKQYFVRGRFHGLAENIHLHTLPEAQGGVVTVFNITDAEKEFRFSVPRELLGDRPDMAIKGAEAKWTANAVELSLTLPPLSPGLICIGHSARE